LEVYKIKLNLFVSDTLTHGEISYLQEIAMGCDDNTGEEVAIARSMLSLYENNRYPRLDECMSEIVRPRNVKERYITDNKLLIFPNPATDRVNILVRLGKSEVGKIRIIDVQSNIVYNHIINNNINTLEIDIKSFNSGMYFIIYKSINGDEHIEKLIIEK